MKNFVKHYLVALIPYFGVKIYYVREGEIMKADLNKLQELCIKLGFDDVKLTEDKLEITLLKDIVLVIMNYEENNKEDSLIAFNDFPWHCHDEIKFVDTKHHYVELDYYEIIQGFYDGDILVADLIENEEVTDRFPVHKDYCDDLDDLILGEALLIRRIR